MGTACSTQGRGEMHLLVKLGGKKLLVKSSVESGLREGGCMAPYSFWAVQLSSIETGRVCPQAEGVALFK